MNKKLYRNTSNKMIAGVCSGLAEYINDADAKMYDIKREHHAEKITEA